MCGQLVTHVDHALLPTPPSACFGTHPKHRTAHPGSQAGGADWEAGAGGAARATPLNPVAAQAVSELVRGFGLGLGLGFELRVRSGLGLGPGPGPGSGLGYP